MGTRQPHYSKEEFAWRGQAIYEQRVRSQVEEGNRGRIVAIDIETGELEVGDDPLAASDQLFARCPDAQPWLIRIGYRALHRFRRSHVGSRSIRMQGIVGPKTMCMTSMPWHQRCLTVTL